MARDWKRSALVAVSAVALAAAVAGCRDDEQGRPLHYTPGVYQGKPIAPLTAEQIAELQKRAQRENY